MPDPRPLNATAASLLGFLHDGPLSGYEIAGLAQRVIGEFWTLTQSQVYRELTWMAEAGFVRPGERGPRDRRRYELTDSGRAIFAAWIDQPPGAETIRHPLLLTVSFGRFIPPDRLATFLRQHRDAHAEQLRIYEAAHGGAPAPDPFQSATLAFGIAYERAVRDWFDALPQSMTSPSDAAGMPSKAGAGRQTGTIRRAD